VNHQVDCVEISHDPGPDVDLSEAGVGADSANQESRHPDESVSSGDSESESDVSVSTPSETPRGGPYEATTAKSVARTPCRSRALIAYVGI
jgi:hypothetical protein